MTDLGFRIAMATWRIDDTANDHRSFHALKGPRGDEPPGLTTMDRVLFAIIACAVLLLLGAAGLHVTKTADLMHHARTVGVAGVK